VKIEAFRQGGMCKLNESSNTSEKFKQLKAYILIGFFVMIYSSVFAQDYIFGKVIDINGEPLPGVSIWMGKSSNYQASDINGEFRILKPAKQGLSMSLSFIGYETVEIENIDTVFYPITITMEESPMFLEQPSRNYFGFVASVQVDALYHSFNNFESVLEKENIDNLNQLNANTNFDYALWYKGFYYALNFGFNSNDYVKLDSINGRKGDYRTFLLGSHFGYNIINSERFLITPKIGIKWYRYRMINYDTERRITMEQYISEKDLDIRFNHLFGFIGLNCLYKFHFQNFPFPPLAVGFYGGYVFKLNDKTLVYSRHNRLTTDHRMDFRNFNFGISFSFIMD